MGVAGYGGRLDYGSRVPDEETQRRGMPMAAKLDEIIFGRAGGCRLSYSMGYNWLESISIGGEDGYRNAVNLLLLEVQKHSKEFASGGCIADYDGNLSRKLEGNEFDRNRFGVALQEAIRTDLPGIPF